MQDRAGRAGLEVSTIALLVAATAVTFGLIVADVTLNAPARFDAHPVHSFALGVAVVLWCATVASIKTDRAVCRIMDRLDTVHLESSIALTENMGEVRVVTPSITLELRRFDEELQRMRTEVERAAIDRDELVASVLDLLNVNARIAPPEPG